MNSLRDSLGREFRYLRLSVTERCNFRCLYCLPNGYRPDPAERAPELSLPEIERLAAGFDRLGFEKIRLTGGEPTVRRDFLEILGALRGFPRLRKVAVTTNGHSLDRLAGDMARLGVGGLNVSVDSLDPASFQAITGRGRLPEVLRGIERAVEFGIPSVKVNAVLLRGYSEKDLASFLEWVRTRPITVRFIELMKTGSNEDLFRARSMSGGEVQLVLRREGWTQRGRPSGGGPAVEFSHPEYQGRIGIIAPYAAGFCDGCNRLRVSSRGDLKLCLFGDGSASLRDELQLEDRGMAVAARVRSLIGEKPAAHRLREGNYGSTWNLASIGG